MPPSAIGGHPLTGKIPPTVGPQSSLVEWRANPGKIPPLVGSPGGLLIVIPIVIQELFKALYLCAGKNEVD